VIRLPRSPRPHDRRQHLVCCIVMGLLFLGWAAAKSVLAAPNQTPSPAPGPRRVAVLVGANAPALGRLPLRYAYRDAERLADALVRVGGFAPADVHILRDPPAQVLKATLSSEVSRLRGAADSLLFFYYSGHADSEAIYPKGEPLDLSWLRERLEDTAITVRIGFIDACRGGGWTRAKGLVRDEADVFDIPPLTGLESAGSVLIASSSGLENAHESEELRGSFFSYHFTAGLLGAADRSEDGEITLNEAFDYAKLLTIRDTARLASTPQHPSFDVHLRGRRDLWLSRVAPSLVTVRLEQELGPLEVLDLRTGQRLAETVPGRRAVALALSPGRYLVRRPVRRVYSADEIDVSSGNTLVVRERDLRPLSSAAQVRTATKGSAYAPRLPLDSSTVQRGAIAFQLGMGLGFLPSAAFVNHGFFLGLAGMNPNPEDFSQKFFSAYLAPFWGITDRLQWQIGSGAFAYRLGQRGRTEVIPWGGLLSWSIGPRGDLGVAWSYRLGMGLDARIPLATWHSILLSAGVQSRGYVAQEGSQAPTTLRTHADVGYRVTFARRVTLNIAVGVEWNSLYLARRPEGEAAGPEFDLGLRVGSMHALGLRPLPLLQVHVSRWLSIDGYMGGMFTQRGADGTYLLGATLLSF